MPRIIYILFAVMLPTILVAAPPDGAWKFDGTADDASPNRWKTVSVDTAAAKGKSGSAFSFNGKTSYVKADVPFTGGSFTFHANALPAAAPSGINPVAIMARRGWHTYIGYTKSKKYHFFVVSKDKKTFIAESQNTYEPGEWHAVTGAFDKENMKISLYVDGEPAATAKFEGEMYPYESALFIGAGNPDSTGFSYSFFGSIDEALYFSRALSPSDVSSLIGVHTGDMSAGLVGYWKFDERAGGTAKDSSGLGHNGPISSGALWAQGKSESALQFNGSNTLVYTVLKQKLTSYTFAAWAKPLAAVGKIGAVCGRPGFHNDLGYSTAKRFYIETFNTEKQHFMAVSERAYEPGEWHHVSGVFDAAAKKLLLYVDGELSVEKPFVGEHFRYGDEFYIGCGNAASANFGYWFHGAVDEVRVYKRALSASDVRSLYGMHAESMGPAVDARYKAVGRTDQPAWFEAKIEIPPLLTDDIRKAVASQSPATSRIYPLNGIPTFEMNGKTMPFMMGDIWYSDGMQKIYLKPFFDSGLEIIRVTMNLGSFPSSAQMPCYWIGDRKYDASGIEPLLWRALVLNPRAKLLLWLLIDPYPEWPIEHPDDVMQNEKGQYAIGTTHFQRYGDKIPAPRSGERGAWSFRSATYRNDVCEMVSNFMRDVERLAPGRSVMGYLIGGGVDAQLYHWNAPNSYLTKPEYWGDYCPASKAEWKTWLKKRYGTKDALAAAWGVSVTELGDLAPPRATELAGERYFHDPRTDRRAMDWKRYITEGRLELVRTIAATIKREMPRPMVVGICSGVSPGRRDCTTEEEFIRDKNIDYELHQFAYSQRVPPNLGGVNTQLASLAVNGKMFAGDWDFPTFLMKPTARVEIGAGIFHDQFVQGWSKDMDTLRAVWRREYSHLWTVNAAAHWNHVFGASDGHDDPAIIEEMKFLVQMSKTVKPSVPQYPMADVAFVYDEKAVDHLNRGAASAPGDWTRRQQNELNASGVPYGQYYAEDLREGKVPRSKLYVLQNLVDIDERLSAAIEKLKSGGATVVFLRDTGYAQSFNDIDALSKTMGMKVSRLEDAPVPSFAIDNKHSLVSWWGDAAAALGNVTWPAECTVFGPFDKSETLPKSEDLNAVSAVLSVGATRAEARHVALKGTFIDLQAVIGGALKAERNAYVYYRVQSKADEDVYFGGGADWWMQWWVNGKEVFNTLEKGNGKSGLHRQCI